MSTSLMKVDVWTSTANLVLIEVQNGRRTSTMSNNVDVNSKNWTSEGPQTPQLIKFQEMDVLTSTFM